MPRRPRIKLADIPQHIVQRGINREPCFFAEEGYHCYLHWLRKSAGDWSCTVVARLTISTVGHSVARMRKHQGRAGRQRR
jgi:putative transposase